MQHTGGRKGVDCSFMVGDMGIGFEDHTPDNKNDKSFIKDISKEHLFIRGNHDDPALCKIHPNYIGDYGFLPKPNIFYVSGGYSIDHHFRTQGIDWWKDEELNEEEMAKALKCYQDHKPKIVVSHECPLAMKIDSVTNLWKFDHNSRTELLLQNMFKIHQPDYWIYGHHHRFLEKDMNGTHFVCLNELIDGKINDCIFEIKDLTWEG